MEGITFCRAAKIAKDSGFAGVEVHSILWGYLLDEMSVMDGVRILGNIVKTDDCEKAAALADVI